MIYTSRYSNPELKSGKYTTVRISLGTPKWNIGFHLDAEMPDLMPFGLLGKFDTESAFRPAYFKRLDQIGTQRIFKQLQRLEDKGKDVVLLCYEDIRKEYSGLDDKTLGLLDKAQSQAMSEANLEFQVLSIVYLPDELKAAQAVIDKARDAVKNCENVWLATDKEYEKWLDAQEIASSAYNVKNVSAAMQIIFKVFENNLNQLTEGWENADPKNDNSMWVPIATLLGRSKIPVGSAKVIKKALDRMVGHGDITNKNLWEGLEYLCADYLGGE